MIVPKGWGYEMWIENNELYCGKHLHVLPTRWCSVHYHKNKKETFYVIKGELVLQHSTNLNLEYWTWDNNDLRTKILKEGESFTLEPMTAHRFSTNLPTPCDFIEFSTHHEDSDSYRIIKGD
jgi:mannose-6-phosphate isomerase-like protein (cupin superfamily)